MHYIYETKLRIYLKKEVQQIDFNRGLFWKEIEMTKRKNLLVSKWQEILLPTEENCVAIAFRSCLGFVFLLVALFALSKQAQPQSIMLPLGANGQAPAPPPDSVTTGNGIDYHNGPVMLGPHNVYLLWYGNWGGNTAVDILPSFITGLDGSLYFNTNTTYGTPAGNIVNSISLSGQVTDNYSQGNSLSDLGLQNAIAAKLQSGALPTDVNGIYFVLTSPDVTQTLSSGSQFCAQYCGYHNHATLNGADIKYAFVGDPAIQCPSGHNPSCSIQGITPNGNEGADAMASIMAHELNETITDPDLNGWYRTNQSGEVGDLCNFMFGPTFQVSNGSLGNITFGARDFLIQQNWVNATVNGSNGLCATSFGPGPTIIVTPPAASLQPGQALTLNASQAVNWNITSILPANPRGAGTLSPAGPSSRVVYTQPSLCSAQFNKTGTSCTVTISATDPNNPNNKTTIFVNLIPPPMILTGVNPSNGTAMNAVFTASVVIQNAAGIGAINDSGMNREINLKFAPAGQPDQQASVCELFYSAGGNVLFINPDTGSVTPSARLGSAGTLSNSQCSVDLQNSFGSINGDTLTVTLPITFSAGFAGPKTIYERSWNGQFFSIYAPVGFWNVP